MKRIRSTAGDALLRACTYAHCALASCVLLAAVSAQAQTALADAPIFGTTSAPGNLSMVLSVEYPTAVSVAYPRGSYVAASTYLGYFDPTKCYSYNSASTDPTTSPSTTPASYFAPAGFAGTASGSSTHICSGYWSGNFLNWASMQTIDTFRWVLTGGYRVIDTAATSVVEKAWASGQGGTGNFPDSTLAAADIAGATPFGPLQPTSLGMRIQGLGNTMRFVVAAPFSVSYYNSTDLSGTAVLTRNEADTSAIQGNVSPGPGVNVYNYSARYVVNVVAPSTGSYIFQTLSDDGARLYLSGGTFPAAPASTMLINNWPAGGQPGTYAQSAAVNLIGGTTYTVTTEFRQFYGGAGLVLSWQTPGATSFSALPTAVSLYATAANFPTLTTPTTATSLAATVSMNTAYDVFMRAKVCDPTIGTEANCTTYPGGYKPEGLLQQYNSKLRFSAFGYLNDSTQTRDAGVLRAAQKFIGPLTPVYGQAAATNLAAEWDATTGILSADPDCSTANPDRPASPACPVDATGIKTGSSGVINYINKFGEASHSYKVLDPVSELYYAAIRYFKNLGNVPEWSTLAGLSAYDTNRLMDGFPVITNWKDPIMPGGSCQRNFILGIGDTHTWYDTNVSRDKTTIPPSTGEPTLPALVASDPSTYPASVAANKVGTMEFPTFTGLTLGSVSPYGSCCSGNSALMAGLAYDAHTTGIRSYPNADGSSTAQTLDTYWLDVQEGGHYDPNNQFYLTAKYGGFTVPDKFKPYDAATMALPTGSWENTNSPPDTLSYGGITNTRPKNYYSAGRPDQMQSGLISAFKDATSKSAPFSTSFSLSVPQVGSSGTTSFAADYVAATWSGDVVATTLTFDPTTGAPTSSTTPIWQFATVLGTQAASTGWNTGRSIVTWSGSAGVPFRAPGATALVGITSAQQATLNTTYISGDDSLNYLNYLRGDRSTEIPATGTPSSGQVYRTRGSLVGDIVNSKPVVIGTPVSPYSDTTNPGYAAFKATARNTVVYVGANDGMLHAIDGATGTELFAYVPSALFSGPNNTPSVDGLASLGNPAFVHHYMVDGPIGYFDVDFSNTAGSAAKANDWHTVLIGSLGKGGKSYFAIDVTTAPSASPLASEAVIAQKVLWEYKDTSALGYTYGRPVVVKTREYGWVVVIGSGYNNGDGVGHFILLNPRTGAVIDKIDLPSGSTGIAQVNAYTADPTDSTADAIYSGDLAGNIWRVDITQTSGAHYPSAVKLATLTDAKGVGQPVTIVPFIQIDPPTRRRFVLVGTGRLLDTTDINSTQIQSFYSLWDGFNQTGGFSTAPMSGGTTTFPITRSMLVQVNEAASVASTGTLDLSGASGWYQDLNIDPTSPDAAAGVTERVVTQMTTSYGSVAFAATIPSSSMCSPAGDSQDYAFAYGSGQSLLVATNNTTVLPYAWLKDTTASFSFVSNNGQATLIQGLNNTPGISKVGTRGIGVTLPHRVNWRELPLVD